MTYKESSMFMALIKISYPTAYRDIDATFAKMTVEMWHSEFASIPYPVMQMALARHRRKSNFAPTIAEIVAQIEDIHMSAIVDNLSAKSIGDHDTMLKSKYLMEATSTIASPTRHEIDYSYIDDSYLDDVMLLGDCQG